MRDLLCQRKFRIRSSVLDKQLSQEQIDHHKALCECILVLMHACVIYKDKRNTSDEYERCRQIEVCQLCFNKWTMIGLSVV